jgi:hypothetical protein
MLDRLLKLQFTTPASLHALVYVQVKFAGRTCEQMLSERRYQRRIFSWVNNIKLNFWKDHKDFDPACVFYAPSPL